MCFQVRQVKVCEKAAQKAAKDDDGFWFIALL
jgi:hypothetical protein